MSKQEQLIERVRRQCDGDARLESALMYGSFTQDLADEWSDIEFWLFFDDDALVAIDPAAWCRDIAPTLLVVKNEFDTHVAVFESLVRGEFHFVSTSAIDAVAHWPARGAPVERMLITDRSGELRGVLEQLPEHRDPPASEDIEQLCGRFANWLLLGDAVLRRGELARAQAVLAEVNRHLLWMVRVLEHKPLRPTPSRLADVELSRGALSCYTRTTAALDREALAGAYREAWAWGREMWSSLALGCDLGVPDALFDAIEARMRVEPTAST